MFFVTFAVLPEKGMRRADLTYEQLLVKLQGWCGAGERCQSEVMRKLYEWGASHNDSGAILSQLVSEGFVDDSRFASGFARGKFSSRKWGRRRIEAELRERRIPAADIKAALSEIDDDEYVGALLKLARQKEAQCTGDDFEVRQKVFHYLVQKGYEPALIAKVLNASPDETDFLTE